MYSFTLNYFDLINGIRVKSLDIHAQISQSTCCMFWSFTLISTHKSSKQQIDECLTPAPPANLVSRAARLELCFVGNICNGFLYPWNFRVFLVTCNTPKKILSTRLKVCDFLLLVCDFLLLQLEILYIIKKYWGVN